MIFMPHNELVNSKFSSLFVGKLEIVCCMRGKNHISRRKKVSPADLSEVDVVLFNNNFFQTDEIKKWFLSEGINPNILLQTGQVSTVMSIINNTDAAGFMFRQLALGESGLLALPLEKELYANVSLVWRKDCYFSESMKIFLEYVKGNGTIL